MEHVQNNSSVRSMLGERGIKLEELPPSKDIKKLERRVKSQEKKLSNNRGNFLVLMMRKHRILYEDMPRSI